MGQRAESASGAPVPSGEEASAAEASVDELKAEIARLRGRVAELESAPRDDSRAGVEERVVSPSVGQHGYDYLVALVNHAPNIFFIKDLEHRYVAISRLAAQYQQMTPEQALGRSERDVFPPEIAEKMIAEEVEVLASGKPLEYEQELPDPSGTRYFYTIKFPIYDTKGAPLGVGAFVTDLTDLKRSELDRLSMKEQVIRAQQAAIRELSTPLVPLGPGVLAMPLVGTIDSMRAREILETLLDGISQQSAHTAILDITGVRFVDTQVANALVSAARAARLLGARVVLTGITPAVARTLVDLESSLDGIVTLGTLASGISYAMRAGDSKNKMPARPGSPATSNGALQANPATGAAPLAPR
ncbi:PAS domain-containing protein [Sorangium sp. So ce119]|uniref:PAS domain-containing protein n=1 Tax=Sorangium sp. So ce119 TaxID=3133279 RepID=UPI003F613F6A